VIGGGPAGLSSAIPLGIFILQSTIKEFE